MAKQTFVADAILTAAQMNALQGNDFNQTVSTKTASYVLVASDAGTKLVMNAGATNTTLTVNTSLFAAGDTLTILNISTSGTCTITAGTATVATAGSLALGLNQSGTLYFTSAGVSVFQADGVAASASGLTLVKSETIGSAVSSVTVSSAFSATYDTYKITLTGGVASARFDGLLTLGATATGYKWQTFYSTYGAGATGEGSSNDSSFKYFSTGNTVSLAGSIDVVNPFLTEETYVFNNYATTTYAGVTSGYLNNSTSYTAFTITPHTGTLTGGTVRVYGYANS